MQKAYLTLSTFLLFLAAWFRFDGVFTNSFAFTYDVGRDMLALQKLAAGHISLIGFTTGLPGVFYGPWWYWILLPSFFIGHGNPQFVAGFMAMCGVLTVLLVSVLGKKLGGNFFSIAIMLLAGVSGQLISLSSQIWNPNIAPLWLSIMLLILYALQKKQARKKFSFQFFLLGLMIGLLFEAEIVFGTLFVVGFIIFLLLFMRYAINLRTIIAAFAGFFVILSPRVFFELRHNFLMTRAILSVIDQSSAHHFSLSTILIRLQFFLNEWSNTIGGDSVWFGISIFLFTLVTLIFLWKKTDARLQFFIQFSLVLTVIAFVILVLFQHDVWSHYIVAFPLLWVLLVASACYLLYTHVSPTIGITALLLIAILNMQPQKLIDRFTKPLFQGDISVYRNQLAVVSEVYKEASGKSFKYIVYTPPIMDYPYQYLFDWYGKTRYGYSPSGPDSKLMFVIIEPDTQHPSLRQNWIELHKNDGTIVREQTFATGVLLEKRVIP